VIDYVSNLTCPDFRPNFKHLHWRPMGHSFGHLIASDWADKPDDDDAFGLYKKCGLWSRDEAAILYNVARRCDALGWVDIGCHTGWTTAHIAGAATGVYGVDPMLVFGEFTLRLKANMSESAFAVRLFGETSREFFKKCPRVSGFCIDGDHEPGKPLEDAQSAELHLADTGVIMLHDGVGRPVREAAEWLISQGFKCRAYFTPHLVFCCWRGDFVPPDHIPDPIVKAAHLDGRYPDFDFARCE